MNTKTIRCKVMQAAAQEGAVAIVAVPEEEKQRGSARLQQPVIFTLGSDEYWQKPLVPGTFLKVSIEVDPDQTPDPEGARKKSRRKFGKHHPENSGEPVADNHTDLVPPMFQNWAGADGAPETPTVSKPEPPAD